MVEDTGEAVSVFISYCRKDDEMRAELRTHLNGLINTGEITVWDDRDLEAGTEWEPLLQERLKTAEIIVLLISANFLASEYCYGNELKLAIARHDAQAAVVIPVIIKPCTWNRPRVPFSKLQVLPDQAKAISLWPDRDQAFAIVTDEISKVADRVLQKRAQQSVVAETAEPVETRKLVTVQFASVRLDAQGQIIDRPSGSAQVFTEDLGSGVALTMVKIPAGKFVMGQSLAEKTEIIRLRGEEAYRNYYLDELPQHEVKVPEFYLGQTLVTQAQWQAVMGKNPAHFKGGGNLPVDSVSWLDAMDFCEKLSDRLGHKYRLPSEAEWEYACRAGTTTPFAFGETITPAIVNYNGNYPYGGAAEGEYRGETTNVGNFPPNGFGLYDMHGNLWEWCLDEYINNYSNFPVNGSARGDIDSRNADKQRLLRGGCWYSDADDCRSASRLHSAAGNRNRYFGLRLVSGPSSTPSRQSF